MKIYLLWTVQPHLHHMHSTTLHKGAGICLRFSHLLSVTQSWLQSQVYDHLLNAC